MDVLSFVVAQKFVPSGLRRGESLLMPRVVKRDTFIFLKMMSFVSSQKIPHLLLQ